MERGNVVVRDHQSRKDRENEECGEIKWECNWRRGKEDMSRENESNHVPAKHPLAQAHVKMLSVKLTRIAFHVAFHSARNSPGLLIFLLFIP